MADEPRGSARERFGEVYRRGADSWSRVPLYAETRDALDQAFALDPLLASRPALDVGCGRGRMLDALEGAGVLDRTGCDLSRDALRSARPHATRGVLQGDAERLPFPDGAFGLVTELTLLSSTDPERWPGLAAELARVLAPGGFYVAEQVSRPDGHPLARPVETACKLPRTLDAVWGFAATDFDRLWPTFRRHVLRPVPVRHPAADTPSWVAVLQKPATGRRPPSHSPRPR